MPFCLFGWHWVFWEFQKSISKLVYWLSIGWILLFKIFKTYFLHKILIRGSQLTYESQALISTLTVEILKKNSTNSSQAQTNLDASTVIVEPCIWCTQKFLQAFQWRPCNVKRLQPSGCQLRFKSKLLKHDYHALFQVKLTVCHILYVTYNSLYFIPGLHGHRRLRVLFCFFRIFLRFSLNKVD